MKRSTFLKLTLAAGTCVKGLEKRIDTKTGSFEADISMAWFNRNFSR